MMDVERLAGGLWIKQKNICETLGKCEDDGRSAQEWISNVVAAASSRILTNGLEAAESPPVDTLLSCCARSSEQLHQTGPSCGGGGGGSGINHQITLKSWQL